LSQLQGYVFTVAYKQYVGSHISYSVWLKKWRKIVINCSLRTVIVKKMAFTVGAKDEAQGKNSATWFSRQTKGAGQEQNIVIFLALDGERLRQRIKCRRIFYCGGRKAWPKIAMSSYFLLWRAKGLAKA
jgi:hypothetical protein